MLVFSESVFIALLSFLISILAIDIVGICQFGLSFVDSPKGNLDMSPPPLNPVDEIVLMKSQMYPYGTTETFVNAIDSSGQVLSNTAHYYAECSNRGLCNRQQGICECLEGYEGSACQRTSCPSMVPNEICSGHGVCYDAERFAALDNRNIYKLWDNHFSTGCLCDKGYVG